MKTLILNNYGVQEMNAGEMQDISGGIGLGDVVTAVKEYVKFAKSYMEFARKNNDMATVGANCM